MSKNLCLCTKPGSLAGLPSILLCDYLEIPHELKTDFSCNTVCCKEDVEACLCVSDSLCLATTSSMLRYLARSYKGEKLYDEKNDCIGKIDHQLEKLTTWERSLCDLQGHSTGTKKLEKN